MDLGTFARGLALSVMATSPCLAQGLRASAAPTGSVSRTQTVIRARIVGEVRLADGSPVADATLSTGGAQATSDANGFFAIAQDVMPGQTIVVTAAARIVGSNHRGAAAPVLVRRSRVDVGTITLARRSFPIYLSPPQHEGMFSLSVAADFDGDGDTDLVGTSGFLENGPDGFVERPFSLGVTALHLAALDLDQDGDPDLLVTHTAPAGAALSTFLNDGHGHFGGALPVSDLTGAEVHGDFDGDTIPDLVLVSAGALSFLRGDGDGTFAAPQVQAAAVSPGPALAADLDGDGDLELALASGAQLALLPGNGDGTFAPAASFSFALGVGQLFAGELSGDGVVDLLALTASYAPPSPPTYALESLLGQGGGAFAAGAATALGSAMHSVSLAELSGDGRADLLVAETSSFIGQSSSSLRVRRGKGDGAFSGSNTVYPVGDFVDVHDLQDFDGDGRLDVIASGLGQSGWALSVYLGRGDGTLAFADSVSGASRTAAAADFDLDGDLDLLLLDPLLARAQLSRGVGDGRFTPVTPFVALEPEGHQVSGDLDGDADLDVVAIDQLTSAAVLLHDGAGHLTLASSLVVGNAPRPLLADFDVDGDLDLACASTSSGGKVFLYPANGDGTFAARSALSAGGAPSSLVAGDFDADGAPDLALQLSFVSYWGGNGDGTFRTPLVLGATGGFFGPRSAADVDGDGALDLVTSQAVLLGHGDGSFAPALTNGIGGEDALDVDGDGRLDLLSAASGAVHLHLGIGDGTFSSAFAYAEPWDQEPFQFYVASPLLADLDGDGDADLLLRYLDPEAPGFTFLMRGRRVP